MKRRSADRNCAKLQVITNLQASFALRHDLRDVNDEPVICSFMSLREGALQQTSKSASRAQAPASSVSVRASRAEEDL